MEIKPCPCDFGVWIFVMSLENQELHCCIRFNWNGHRGMLPRALDGKLVQSTGGTDCTIAAVGTGSSHNLRV